MADGSSMRLWSNAGDRASHGSGDAQKAASYSGQSQIQALSDQRPWQQQLLSVYVRSDPCSPKGTMGSSAQTEPMNPNCILEMTVSNRGDSRKIQMTSFIAPILISEVSGQAAQASSRVPVPTTGPQLAQSIFPLILLDETQCDTSSDRRP